MTHYNFIVDCSGSMTQPLRQEHLFGKYIESVARWEAMRHTVRQCLMNLEDSDTFSIIEFESMAYPLVANMKAGGKDVRTVMQDLDNNNIKPISGPYGIKHPIFFPRGGTNITEALRTTLQQTPRNTPTVNLLFTDDWEYESTAKALMSPLYPNHSKSPMLDALLADGFLLVTYICASTQKTQAVINAAALETKVNQYQLDKLSYKQLQAQCKEMGVSAVGKKQDLIGRLLKEGRFSDPRFACGVETFPNNEAADSYPSFIRRVVEFI